MRRRSTSSSIRTPIVKRRQSTLGFDEFGFALSKKREQKLNHRSHEYSYPQPDAVRVKQLCELLSYWKGSSFICRSQIERFIRMGIPPSLRGRVWKCLLDLDSIRESGVFNYQACLDEIRKPLVDLGVSEYSIISALSTLSQAQSLPGLGFCREDVALFQQIALDLQRSFPTHRSLMGESPEAIEGQAKLFRVLTAYAKYNPQIGYSQGMACIAAVLLMHLSEEEAFWALVVLLQKPKYLSELFDLSSEKIQHQVAVFQLLLKHRRCSLSRHMENCGVMPLYYAMPWFLALFTCLPCWDSVLAVWDLIMLQGMTGVFRAALAVLSLLEPRLMALTDHATMLPLLLRVPVELAKHHVLLPAIWAIEVQESEMKDYDSLATQKTGEDPCKENLKPNCTSPPPTAEPKTLKSDAKTPTIAAKEPTKEAAGFVTKNVFTRMLRVAQRCLLVVSQPSGGSKPSSSSSSSPQLSKARASSSLPQAQTRAKRRSQKALRTLARKQGPSPQDSDAAGATQDCSEPGLRRLKSDPVGRGARRKSVHRALRRRSLHFCPIGSPRSDSHKLLLSPQSAQATAGHYRLLSPQPGTWGEQETELPIRESQLI
ncbi:TBC1 domain family member 16 [Clupea harengus]|uniref:TBC1 domain family member 16 n=1 Tax=Clupea harengus TaxID=7950 RepID=A0A6P3WBQ8_CLUHA|nr:TBC1 domain family member 16 [Clupea harengus]